MAEFITIYGAIGCEYTARAKDILRQRGVPFQCVNVDHNTAVERFVLFINRGLLITPTVLIDRGKYKTVLVRPNDDDLESALASISYFLVR